jgi:hypothetical protein
LCIIFNWLNLWLLLWRHYNLSISHAFYFHGDFGKWAWCIWWIRNQLIAWANTHNLHQTRVPRLEFGTWRNPACAAFRTYQSMDSYIFLGYPAHPPEFSSYPGYGKITSRAHSCANTRPRRTDPGVLPSWSMSPGHSDMLSRRTRSENIFFESLVWLL